MVTLVVASSNAHKIDEIRAILGTTTLKIHALRDYPSVVMPEEVGDDFESIALLKARSIAAQIPGVAVLADDSGLEVAALGGAPGILSARFAGEPTSDATNNAKLLALMEGVSDRRAAFACAMALVYPDGREVVVLERVAGVVMDKAAGRAGFGYDPLFFYPPLNKTFAELSQAEKGAISHRSRALSRIQSYLSDFA